MQKEINNNSSVGYLLCVQISFEGCFSDFEALFREIGTMFGFFIRSKVLLSHAMSS